MKTGRHLYSINLRLFAGVDSSASHLDSPRLPCTSLELGSLLALPVPAPAGGEGAVPIIQAQLLAISNTGSRGAHALLWSAWAPHGHSVQTHGAELIHIKTFLHFFFQRKKTTNTTG